MKAVVLCCSALALAGCASAVESSKIEDGARRSVPVAICLKPLPRHGDSKSISSIAPEEYWGIVLPSYDASSGTIDRAAPDCAGRPLLARPELLQSQGSPTGPLRATAAEVVLGQGPDGFRIVWLRSHRFADGTAGGPIALVRAKEAYAEVYATGLYRGSAERSRFGFERLGPDILVTATDEGCAGVKANQNCETTLVTFLSSAGQLQPSTRFAVDRVQYGQAPGIVGLVQYRLTATPVFQDRVIRLAEQVVVKDATQTEIRKSDLERVFQLRERYKLVANSESLWNQVTAGSSQAKAPAPAPPSKGGGKMFAPPPPPPPPPPP